MLEIEQLSPYPLLGYGQLVKIEQDVAVAHADDLFRADDGDFVRIFCAPKANGLRGRLGAVLI